MSNYCFATVQIKTSLSPQLTASHIIAAEKKTSIKTLADVQRYTNGRLVTIHLCMLFQPLFCCNKSLAILSVVFVL